MRNYKQIYGNVRNYKQIYGNVRNYKQIYGKMRNCKQIYRKVHVRLIVAMDTKELEWVWEMSATSLQLHILLSFIIVCGFSNVLFL